MPAKLKEYSITGSKKSGYRVKVPEEIKPVKGEKIFCEIREGGRVLVYYRKVEG